MLLKAGADVTAANKVRRRALSARARAAAVTRARAASAQNGEKPIDVVCQGWWADKAHKAKIEAMLRGQ